MRLIDADALYDDVMERYCKDCEKRKGMKRGKWRVIYDIGEAPCRACDVDDMKTELEEAPTIDAELVRYSKWDAVDDGCRTRDAEIVRCKDCKFNYANQIPSGDECQLCVELPISKDFFCAYGEKLDKEMIE